MTAGVESKRSRLKVLACFVLSALLCFALQPGVVWAADDAPSKDSSADAAAPEEPPADDGAAEEPQPVDTGDSGDSGDAGDSSDGGSTDEPAAEDQTDDKTETDPADDADPIEEADVEDGADDAADADDADPDDAVPADEEEEALPAEAEDEKADDKEAKDKKKSKDDSESDDDSDDGSLSSWAQGRLDKAQEGINDSDAALGRVPGALGSLRSAKAVYDETKDELDSMVAEYTSAGERMKDSKLRSETARPAAKLAQAELDALDGLDPHTYAVKKGMSVLEARNDEELLRWIAESADAAADSADSVYAESKKTQEDLTESIKQQEQVVAEALMAANDCAYEAEVACSESRSGEVAAKEALAELDENIKEANDARDELESVIDSHDGVRQGAYSTLDEWYDDLDKRAGADEGRLTFGTGLEFTMEKDAFVKKWGAVIDAYYAEIGNPPLGGYGETMAAEAWEWKIDPRLCAAVSFTESGGGAACIRHCNAWGWGAADSDPYNLASEWGSWEEAIAAWHSGMGTNGMGLATARSVDELGSSYAGAPHWSSNVVNAMDRMEDLAAAQESPSSPLTLAQPSE